MASAPTFDLRSLDLHGERLRAFVVALVGDEHAADDALQDVWMRALQGGPREPEAIAGWLRAIARRVVLNHHRGSARRRFRERRAARSEALPSSYDLAERVELQRRVLDALAALDEPHRTLLRDHYFGGVTIRELAQRTGANVHTTKDRVERARAAMRRALARAGLDEREDSRWALVLAPWQKSARLLLAGSFVMQKSTAIIAVLIAAVALVLWSSRDGSRALEDAPLATAAAPATRLAPVDIDGPAVLGPSERSAVAPATIADLRDEAEAIDRDWVVRGRVAFSDGASGALPSVRLQLAAYEGYRLTGEPFARAQVESTVDGEIVWALPDPLRTVSIRAQLEDVPGHSASVTEHYLAVVGEGPVESIRVLVKPLDAWLAGTVRASDSAPNPGAPIEGARLVYNDVWTTSDANGAFRLAVPSRGYGSLIATAQGFHGGGETPGGLEAGVTTRVVVTLDPELGPEGTVFGYVRDARGGVLPGALVRCASAREETVRTDATGHYELRGIRLHADGDVVVTASHAGLAAQEKGVRGPADGSPRAEGTQLDFELVPGSRIDGTVLDFAGRPVRGAEVWIGPHSGLVANRRAHSDDEGAFVFDNATPGRTMLGVRKRGQPGHVQDLIVPADGAPIQVTVQFERASPLRGRVVDTAGAPVVGVVVEVRKGEYGRSIRLAAATSADGTFEIAAAPEGELEVTASRTSIVRTRVTHVHDGRPLELRVERSAHLAGRVVDAETGRPIEAFVVRLAPPGDEALGPWFNGIDIAWVIGGRSFSAVDGRWSTDEKDPIRRGAWTLVEVEAEGYEVQRVGPLQVADAEGTEEWVHRLVPR